MSQQKKLKQEFDLFKKNTAFREGLNIARRNELEKEVEQAKELIKELWSLWDSMAECGELSIGPKFCKQYDALKLKVKRL